MQSFFIATELFSGKNTDVQNETETEPAPSKPAGTLRRRALIALIAVAVTAIILNILLALNTNMRGEGRDMHTPFPWQAAGVTIDDVRVGWIPAEDQPLLRRRGNFDSTAYVPAAVINLEEAEGSGRIYASFCNSAGNRYSDLIVLRYRDGSLEEKHDPGIDASGQKAVISIAAGLPTEADLREMQIRDDLKLWTLRLEVQPDGQDRATELGLITIAPAAVTPSELTED